MGIRNTDQFTIRMLRTEYSGLYNQLLTKIRGYNAWKPFHEDTGEKFSAQEREEFQREHIKTLRQIARQAGIEGYLHFSLKSRIKIVMNVEGIIVSR